MHMETLEHRHIERADAMKPRCKPDAHAVEDFIVMRTPAGSAGLADLNEVRSWKATSHHACIRCVEGMPTIEYLGSFLMSLATCAEYSCSAMIFLKLDMSLLEIEVMNVDLISYLSRQTEEVNFASLFHVGKVQVL